MTRTIKDVVLPPVKSLGLGVEGYAYHEEFYRRGSSRYMIPTRRALKAGAEARAAEYIRGRWQLELIRRTIDDAFADCDLVVLPTRRRTPRTIDAAIKREESDKPRNPESENTGQFNVYGIPAISVPCGFTSGGLPIGLMIAGPRFSEAKVLAIAHAYERATDWRSRKPPLAPDTPVPELAPTEESE
jgi:aspartyl-tRNA(Asn)/glutamyl-tRNA(Gln) amidotransferase subunit A